MTYSIIPPILVVASLIGIILFLMRKAPELAELEERERMMESNSNRTNLLNKTVSKIKDDSESAWKHKLLLFLEKVTRRFKVIFLKLENVFNSWNESIRQKRRSQLKETRGILEQKSTEDILEKVREYKTDAEATSTEEELQPVSRVINREMPERERQSRPMISDRVTTPRRMKRIETKDRLERILIDRIAANPKDTEAYERLGEYYFEIENFNHAKECFKQVLKLNPNNVEVKNRMKKLERLLGR